jgi:diadenosine tetraphosphate (Ap4A) HIT family hydrolase
VLSVPLWFKVLNMFIAEDLDQFKQLFVSKLKAMLSDAELGAFILVLANSYQDKFLQGELEDDLKQTFAALRDNYFTGRLDATQDDIDVFKQLLELDLAELPVWQNRQLGDWEVTYNAMRRLRPARASSEVLTTIMQPYDASKFHFNKPFLAPEILWQGEFEGVNSRVLFNKFPFSDYHLLIVLSPEKNSSQLLTRKDHQHVYSLVEQLADVFPGFGVGFNSLAAGASVNHLHFQGFVRDTTFAIERDHWSHNGGDIKYPLTVKCFTDAESSWAYLQQLILQDKAFNCLYRDGRCYVVSRRYQGSVELPGWLQGAGWIDVAGAVTVSEREAFEQFTEEQLAAGIGLLNQVA